MKNKVAQLWEDIFDDYNILDKIKEEGLFKITAAQIRKYKEPRLMAKFDCLRQLPSIFKDNQLGILPIKNGEYIIGRFNLFQKISNTNYQSVAIEKVELPLFIETIDPDNVYSESNALMIANLSGMLEKTFREPLYETIQGKMRTDKFNFKIYSDNVENNIEVNGAAIEIDGGYESENSVVLVEAKNNMCDDFIIRQLYYPYRLWLKKTLKPVIPVFFVYDNGVYNIFVYAFESEYNYNSIRLKDIKRYVVSNKTNDTLKEMIFRTTKCIEELPQSEVPLPQADCFSKVITTLNLINNGFNTAEQVATELDFDYRQGKYYIDALRYIDLIERGKERGQYNLTSTGLISLGYTSKFKLRNKYIIKQILLHKPFYDAYKYYLENGELPNREVIKTIIKKYIPDMADKTINRSSSTIRGWIQWIIGAQVR